MTVKEPEPEPEPERGPQPERGAQPEPQPEPQPEAGEPSTRFAAPATLVRWGAPGSAAIIALGAVVLLVIGATLGVALAPSRSSSVSVGGQPGSVDIGFARDMIVHHTQGVSMANLAELHTQDDDVRVTAFDISTTQQTDIGELSGWLDLWGDARISPDGPMAWMTGSAGHAGMGMSAPPSRPSNATDGSADGATYGGATNGGATNGGADGGAADGAVMPGMATNTEMAQFRSLTGAASDIFFLQLMIRHHQGGAAMMRYAAVHASLAAVRNFAGKMLNAQTGEIRVMTRMLSRRKAEPLPFTAPAVPTG